MTLHTPIPEPCAQNGGEAWRKSAEIVSLRELAETRAEINRLTKETIRGAFPAPSQHQTCVAAGRMLGCDPDTIERMMAGLTKRPDLMLLCAACRVYADRNKRPAPMALILAKAMGLQA